MEHRQKIASTSRRPRLASGNAIQTQQRKTPAVARSYAKCVVCKSSAHTSREPPRPRFMRLSDPARTARISRKADKVRRTKQEGPSIPRETLLDVLVFVNQLATENRSTGSILGQWFYGSKLSDCQRFPAL